MLLNLKRVKPYAFLLLAMGSYLVLSSCNYCRPELCNAIRFEILAFSPNPFDSILVVGKGKYFDLVNKTIDTDSLPYSFKSAFFFDPTLTETTFLVCYPNDVDTLTIRYEYEIYYNDCNDYYFALQDYKVEKNTFEDAVLRDLPCGSLIVNLRE